MFIPLLYLVIRGVISCKESVLDHCFTSSSQIPTWHADFCTFQEEVGVIVVRFQFDMKENDASKLI